MRVNPGGNLAPNEVVGRDRFIKKLWRILERQSLVLTAERRMGKTSVVKKMDAECPDEILSVYRDLESIESPLEFAQQVYNDVARFLSLKRKGTEGVRALLMQLAGTEIGGLIKFPDSMAPHWKLLLQRTIDDLLQYQDCPVIFFWDELPLMLYKIQQQQGETVAQEILDVLRSLRQMHPNYLRMVYTGSVGLHHVLTSLRKQGYANSPLNDMKVVDLPHLELDAAEDLAAKLLAGEGLEYPDCDRAMAATKIAVEAGFVPYFIHQLVDHLLLEGGHPLDLTEVVYKYLLDPQDPWHLRYYRERIDTYYSKEMIPVALAVLDVLAGQTDPLDFEEINNYVRSQAEYGLEQVLQALTLLQQDHYLLQNRAGAYDFRFYLVAASWRTQRGLR